MESKIVGLCSFMFSQLEMDSLGMRDQIALGLSTTLTVCDQIALGLSAVGHMSAADKCVGPIR